MEIFSAHNFGRNYCGMPGHIVWELRLNYCTCERCKVQYCHVLVQLPVRHDLCWFWAKHCSHYTTNLTKQMAEKPRFYSWNIFGTRFSTQLLWYAWSLYVGLRLNSCLCAYQTVLSCHPIVQLPSRNDLRWCRQSIARITQPTYQKKRRKVCVVSLKIFLALVLWRNCCGMRNHLMQELRLNSYRCEYQRVQKNTLCPMIWTKH